MRNCEMSLVKLNSFSVLDEKKKEKKCIGQKKR